MERLIDYFDCGHIKKKSKLISALDFTVTNFKDLDQKIIPFFKKYPLEGTKALNFDDFCKVAEIVKAKTHLTNEGLDKIINIKAGMNKRNRRK